LNEDFVELLQALVESGVEFIIVGAHALAAHGLPRATGDLDVLVRPSAENAARVISALRAFGAPLEAHGVSQADFERSDTVYQIGLPPRRIDLLTSISGVPFERAWASKVSIELMGLDVFVLGFEALVANKRATGRAKDVVDADALERAKSSGR
jgi:hypothetical protein